MSVDTSPESYERYRLDHAQFRKQWPNLAGMPKPYSVWADAQQHRDHPLWPEYVDARRYSVPPFPLFPEWLEHMQKFLDSTKETQQ